jgi:hypothetical protein
LKQIFKRWRNGMKKSPLVILLGLIIGTLVLGLMSCDLSGTTIDARIDSFIYDINYNRANVYQNFHPTETTDYDAIKNGTKLLPLFPTNAIPYSREALDTSDPNNVTTVLNDGTAEVWGPKDAIFAMVKDGMTWYINDFYLATSWVIQ